MVWRGGFGSGCPRDRIRSMDVQALSIAPPIMTTCLGALSDRFSCMASSSRSVDRRGLGGPWHGRGATLGVARDSLARPSPGRGHRSRCSFAVVGNAQGLDLPALSLAHAAPLFADGTFRRLVSNLNAGAGIDLGRDGRTGGRAGPRAPCALLDISPSRCKTCARWTCRPFPLLGLIRFNKRGECMVHLFTGGSSMMAGFCRAVRRMASSRSSNGQDGWQDPVPGSYAAGQHRGSLDLVPGSHAASQHRGSLEHDTTKRRPGDGRLRSLQPAGRRGGPAGGAGVLGMVDHGSLDGSRDRGHRITQRRR